MNHGLKNTMADAAGNLDIFLSQFERNKKQVNVGLLKMSREGLQRGMLSCRNREIYINLCAGAWQPALAPVSLPAFAEALLQGRPVASDIVNVTVRMDQTLCWLVFDNAITNALRHGDPTNPDVRFTITCPASPSNGSKRNLSFRVSNRASPRPLRLNQVAMIRAPENQGQSFSLSEDLLMEHIRLGAAAQGMTYSFGREGDLVVFRANLEVELAPQEQVMIPQPPLSPPLPSGLTYLFIDDSDSQRRLVDHGIRTRAAPRDVLLFGKSIAEVEQFLAVAVEQGRQAAMSDNPHGLVAILDQNIDVEGEEFKGTAFVTELLGMSLFRSVRPFPACPGGLGLGRRSREHCWGLQDHRGTQDSPNSYPVGPEKTGKNLCWHDCKLRKDLPVHLWGCHGSAGRGVATSDPRLHLRRIGAPPPCFIFRILLHVLCCYAEQACPLLRQLTDKSVYPRALAMVNL